MESKKTIFVVSAPSGGHLKPTKAVSDLLRKRLPNLEILFLITGKLLERRILKDYKVEVVKSFPITGVYLIYSFKQLFSLFKNYSPLLVIVGGGYATLQVALLAKLNRIPVVALEQNLIPGRANRFLYRTRLLNKIYLSFEETRSYFRGGKAIVTGNPLEEALLELWEKEPVLSFDPITIVVLGGSQGSETLNRIVPQAIVRLPKDIKDRLKVIHQTGIGKGRDCERIYREEGIDSQVIEFIDNMKEVYEKATLVVSRAGATTIFELMVAGKPALFIPYPKATDNHQYYNAKAIVERGGGFLMLEGELDSVKLARFLSDILKDEKTLKEKSSSMRRMAKPFATKFVVNDIEELIRV